MDCALFIRSKRVLAAWIAVPLLLLFTLHLTVAGFYRQQKILFEQKQALSRMVPEMQREADAAKQFLDIYKIGKPGNGSVEDFCIGLLNDAQNASGMTIDTWRMTQQPIDPDLRTERLTINLEGTGSLRQITTFLKTLNEKDSMFFENSMQILSGPPGSGKLKLEVSLVRIYAR